MNVAIGGDHAGYPLKQAVLSFMAREGVEVHDFGPYSAQACDYPDFAHIVSLAVLEGEYRFGILICGSGNGVAMTANKHAGIRAALCWEPELARLARAHNDANILCLPARYITEVNALECIQLFLTTPFEGGRHMARVQKINIYYA